MAQITVEPITIPYKFKARSYQMAFVNAMQGSMRNAALVWHRRAGKDKTVLNFTIAEMFKRIGTYYYFFPTYAQGKKVIWDGMGSDGFKFMDHFPPEIVEDKNETEMQVKLKNGSVFQIVGTDKIDSIVGTNPVGCVFSEYAIQSPRAYDLVRPILLENKGWTVFVYTPRGKNHGYKLWDMAQHNKNTWYSSMLTVMDTKRDGPGESGLPVFSEEDIASERAEGMSEELIQQEYYCSFEGAMEGSYYGDLIMGANVQGRVHAADYLGTDNDIPTITAWDLGIDDCTAIVFCKNHPLTGDPYICGFYEEDGYGLDHYRDFLLMRGERYSRHFWPWDAQVREWSSGKTRYQSAMNMGFGGYKLGPIEVLPKIPNLADGINGTRVFLARAHWLQNRETDMLIDRLRSYRREYDDKSQTWGQKPVHDWTSHAADATRALAQGWFERPLHPVSDMALTEFNVFGENVQEASSISQLLRSKLPDAYEPSHNPYQD